MLRRWVVRWSGSDDSAVLSFVSIAANSTFEFCTVRNLFAFCCVSCVLTAVATDFLPVVNAAHPAAVHPLGCGLGGSGPDGHVGWVAGEDGVHTSGSEGGASDIGCFPHQLRMASPE